MRMKPLKIGMLTACYLPRINGVTRMVSMYRKHLEALGHKVTLFTFAGPGHAANEPGVIRTLGIPLGEGYSYSFGLGRRTRRVLREMDLVHCHHIGMGLDMARRYFSGPVVFSNHTRYDLYSQVYARLPVWAAKRLTRFAWGRPLNHADVVIAPSRRLKHRLRSIGVHRPVAVIPNGIETGLFANPVEPASRRSLGFPHDALLCIFVGRVAEEKNVAQLTDQFSRAAALNPEVHLLIVGDGPIRARLQAAVTKNELAHRIRFTGPVPFSEVPNILAAGDLFITASRSEVHSLAVMEAMAAGLPVLAPAKAGFEETIVHGRNGVIFKGEDGLCRAILETAADRDRRRSLGERARQDSRGFDFQFTLKRTLALYRQIADSGR